MTRSAMRGDRATRPDRTRDEPRRLVAALVFRYRAIRTIVPAPVTMFLGLEPIVTVRL